MWAQQLAAPTTPVCWGRRRTILCGRSRSPTQLAITAAGCRCCSTVTVLASVFASCVVCASGGAGVRDCCMALQPWRRAIQAAACAQRSSNVIGVDCAQQAGGASPLLSRMRVCLWALPSVPAGDVFFHSRPGWRSPNTLGCGQVTWRAICLASPGSCRGPACASSFACSQPHATAVAGGMRTPGSVFLCRGTAPAQPAVRQACCCAWSGACARLVDRVTGVSTLIAGAPRAFRGLRCAASATPQSGGSARWRRAPGRGAVCAWRVHQRCLADSLLLLNSGGGLATLTAAACRRSVCSRLLCTAQHCVVNVSAGQRQQALQC